MIRRLAISLLGAGLLSAMLAAPASSEPDTYPPSTVGVIGCSNTDQHISGYLTASDVDVLAPIPDLGGGSLKRWYTNERNHWAIYQDHEPPGGYQAVWIQVCLKTSEHSGTFSEEHRTWMSYVADEVARRSGSIPVFVSPLNFYVDGHVCPATGPAGQAIAVEIADWAAATLDNVERGPDTGPLGPAELSGDDCHLNTAGKAVVGEQLVAWFDDNQSGGGTDPGDGQSAGEEPFVDISDSVFEADILWIAGAGITRGCNPPTNDRFCPDQPVTRGQMAAFLSRALDLTHTGSWGFRDTSGSIFEQDIDRLAAARITLGCNPPTNDLFCPDQPVTRGQMAAFLSRALDLTHTGSWGFRDTSGSIFEQDIDRLAAARITLGCNPPTNDLFCPDQPVTRGQMAAFLHRAARMLP